MSEVTQEDKEFWEELHFIFWQEFDADGHRAIARHRTEATAAKDALLREVLATVETDYGFLPDDLVNRIDAELNKEPTT